VQPTEADRVISERTSAEMRAMLRQVVVRGTARAADVEGYEVGGKTGTADKPNATGGYSRDRTIATFAAFFPASAPKYVLVIALDEPTAMINDTAFRTAGLTAAPVLAHAIRRIAPVMGMRPEVEPAEPSPLLYTLAGNE
jgi:cell division protein FtsI (penicillin-binding protein 3)